MDGAAFDILRGAYAGRIVIAVGLKASGAFFLRPDIQRAARFVVHDNTLRGVQLRPVTQHQVHFPPDVDRTVHGHILPDDIPAVLRPAVVPVRHIAGQFDTLFAHGAHAVQGDIMRAPAEGNAGNQHVLIRHHKLPGSPVAVCIGDVHRHAGFRNLRVDRLAGFPCHLQRLQPVILIPFGAGESDNRPFIR